MNLLLVEDDMELGNGVRIALTEQGMKVVWVRRMADAIRQLEQHLHDMVLLDIGLPDGSGLDLLLRLRGERRQLPILILSARDSINDRLFGLDNGADDYLVKPFDLAELLSRVRALARRSYGLEDRVITRGGLSLNEQTRRVLADGRQVDLSPSEFELLSLLLKRAGRVITRRVLEAQVLPGGHSNGSNTLEVHISNLRRKIGPSHIRTIRGIGYVFEHAGVAAGTGDAGAP
jgi:two-component system response regulator QseB